MPMVTATPSGQGECETVPESMRTHTDILYPLARSKAGRAEHVREAVKGHPYECFGCSAPMVARQGAKRQWHFAHKPPFERCADPDKALHNAAMAMIVRGFHDALGQQNEYHLGCPCNRCGRAVSRNIAVPGTSVETEKGIVAGTRSDLVVGRTGKAPVVIEVVVTHDLEPEAHEAYMQSGVPVLKVRPTWETVTKLESGIITDDTLNVPPIQCAACRKAEEDRRREEERIRGLVDSMLQRMDLRQQATATNLPFTPWTHDKFGRPMFQQIRQQVYSNAIILTELGFAQAKNKPWLFRFPLNNAVVFANFGSTDVVPIWKDSAALIHWSMAGHPSKLEYALVEGVLARCRAAGADVRVDFYHGRFDRDGNHVAKNSIAARVDKAVLNRLLAQADQSFPEAERQLTQVREAEKKAEHAAALRRYAAQAEAERQRQEAANNRRMAEQEQWTQLNEWIKERSFKG